MARPCKPWFRKSNKTWYVEFHGKQVNLGRNKKDAYKLFHELMTQPEEQEPKLPSSTISLPELVDHFLKWVHRNRAAAHGQRKSPGKHLGEQRMSKA